MKINPVIMPDGTFNFYHAIIDKLEIENLDGVSESVIESTKAELQAEYDATQYRRDRQARYNAELPMGDQFDAILKGFNQLRFDGQNLPADLDEVIGIWLGIKSAIPKE
jgi:hypothetical protein